MESIRSLGEKLLQSSFVDQLDARRELDSFLSSGSDISELLVELEKTSTPSALWVELCNSIARLSRPATMDGSNEIIHVLESPVLVRFLCVALDDGDTSVGSAAASALNAVVALSASTIVRSTLSQHLRRNSSLLRLFDLQSGGAFQGVENSPLRVLCETLRIIPLSASDLINEDESTTPNVLDDYILDRLVADAIREGDVLLLMNALYAAAWILRTSESMSTSSGRILQLITIAIDASKSQDDSDSDLAAIAPMASMLRPFALRSIVTLLDSSTFGVEIALRYEWLPAVLTLALSYHGAQNKNDDIAAAWDILSAVCTSAAGLAALADLQHANRHFLGKVQLDNAGCVHLLSDEVVFPIVERIVGRGDETIRVALLRFVGCAVFGPQEVLRRRKADEEKAIPVPIIAISRSLFRCIWALRNNAEPLVRVALWQCAKSCLGASLALTLESTTLTEMRTAIAASSAAQLTSTEEEPSADVRSEMLNVAHLALRESSVALFHDRLRALVKAGIWPARISAALEAEVPR